jgi:predicted Zn finger-like uncharacterized protein
MIIQCQKCQTRFRLDDSRVTDKGVKVRCTKCKHVFTVLKEQPEVESFESEGVLAGFSASFEQATEPAATPEDRLFAPKSFEADPLAAEATEDSSLGREPADFSSLDTSFLDVSAMSFGSDGLDSINTGDAPEAAAEPAGKGGEVDFSGFDFGDGAPEPDSTPLSKLPEGAFIETAAALAPASSREEAPQEFEFSDDIFGSVAQTAPESPNDSISFDFADDGFAETKDMMSGPDSGVDVSGGGPFNPDEIVFGDEPVPEVVQQVVPDDLKPSGEVLSAPPVEAHEKTESDEPALLIPRAGLADDQQELPPLSIASRRKQSPIFGVLIAVIAVLVVSVLGYLGYSSLSTPKETAAPETGKISVRAVKADFIKNDKVGELLVVSGEALNEYPKARASLQVKVTVFDAAGQSIATKNAYGGNPLTKEQLEILPLDKIEAAMANQFGDSLANLEVAPGKVIPFVVALANLPKGAKDFAVQSAGSTVATGKQQ